MSFTPMDGGVSGALRNACAPDVVVGKEKTCWPDEGNRPFDSLHVEPHHAGMQPAAGRLAAQGVKFIVHAVGPVWKEYPTAGPELDGVGLLIEQTCRRALRCAVKCGATSITIPALSGGIFCHDRPADLREWEQHEARSRLIKAIDEHVAGGTRLKEIVLIDLPSGHPASRVDLLYKLAKLCIEDDASLTTKSTWRAIGGKDGEAAMEADAAHSSSPSRPPPPPPLARRGTWRCCRCVSFGCCAILGGLIVLLIALIDASLQSNGLTDGTLPFMHRTEPHGLSGFHVPDLYGRRVLITGASSGLGLGVARLFASRRATVLVTARDAAKCVATVDALRAHAGRDSDVACIEMDLLNLTSIDTASIEVGHHIGALDWLVLNAGIMNPPTLELSHDTNLEIQFQTNHLGHFLLLHRMLPLLLRTRRTAPRVVAVSSLAHWFAPSTPLLTREALNDAKGYNGWTWYGWSKLCNILMAAELNRREPSISAYSVHPGGVQGKLLRYAPLPEAVVRAFESMAYWDIDTAALTVAAPLLGHAPRDSYFVPIGRRREPSQQSKSPELARDLWAWSEALLEESGVAGVEEEEEEGAGEVEE